MAYKRFVLSFFLSVPALGCVDGPAGRASGAHFVADVSCCSVRLVREGLHGLGCSQRYGTALDCVASFCLVGLGLQPQKACWVALLYQPILSGRDDSGGRAVSMPSRPCRYKQVLDCTSARLEAECV
ncbi:hypothetical protein V8C42DRAFT_309717 [Trichoderma barbatum]